MFWNKKKNPATSTHPAPAHPPLALSLEPRMLFDGAIAATTADADPSSDTQSTDSAQVQTADDTAHQAGDATTPPAATSDQRQEVVFVDSKVTNYQQLVDGIKPGTEVVVLDGSQDGLLQIADYLQGRSGIDAIHILSHGDTGKIQLSGEWVSSETLSTQSDLLKAIGSSLKVNGDILLYGCHVGVDGTGLEFVQSLAALTSAEVAASNNLTGAATAGGDWVLEVNSGTIEATQPFSSVALETYSGTLGAPANGTLDFSGVTVGIKASGDASTGAGITASDVGGWDINVKTTDPRITVIEVGDSAWPSQPGLMVYAQDFGGIEIQSIRFTPDDGSRFDLNSFVFGITDVSGADGTPTITVTAYRNGVSTGSVTIVGDNTLQNPANFSANTNFDNIDYFVIAGQSAGQLGYLDVDDLSVSNVTPPSTTPTLTATSNNPSFTESGSAVDLFGSVLAATNDSGQTFTSAELTVSNVGNGAAEILNIGGTNVALSHGNTGSIASIGTYSVSLVGGTATVTLTGMTRDNTQMGVLIDGITYRNTSEDPGAASRVITLTQIVDSGGSNNTTAPSIASTVTMTPVNDAPTASATGGTPTYTENGSAVDLFSGVSIGTVEAGQTLTGMTLSVSNLADGSSEILRIDGTDIALTNGNSGTTAGNGIGYSISLAGGMATITLNKAGGVSTAVVQPLVDGMSYRNNSDTPSTATRVVTLTGITDNGGTANGGVDSTSLSIASTVTVVAVNDAPTVANAIANQNASEEAVFNFQFAGNTFSDADIGDSLTYSAQLAGGGALPAWLSFDPVTRTFSGTPGNADVGTLNIEVTANDGNGGTVTDTFDILVANTNDAPTLANAIPNQNASEDAAFNFQFAANTFSDADIGDTLTYSTQLAGGGALPAWLSFDPVTRTFSGTPGNADVGTLSIEVTANDGNGGTATDTFNILVANTNDAPTLANAIPNQNATEEAAFNFQFAANTFSDADIGDTLTYSTQLAGGGALPAWLSFDPVTRTFSGTPGNADVGTLSIEVTANDGNGGTVTDTFDILVTNTNDAPTVVNAIANQNATEEAAFNFQFAANTFSDADIGDTLTYSAQLAGGGALPAWLSFDPVTRTFSGTPGNADVGTLSIEVTANDGNGGTVTDTFDIVITAVNDAPVISAPATITVSEDMPGALTGISFSDVDAGTSATTVTLSVASGSLSATSGSGVIVGGTADSMTLTGSIADINAFIAASSVSFTTASNATANVTLTIGINDNGNTGSGGAQTDTTTLTLTVTAVNDAPVNLLPAAQSVDQDSTLVFSSGNANLISISDVDAGSSPVEVTLTASNGLLVLSGTTGLTFTTGDGTADSSMTFTGSIANINNALNGLTFSPTAGYNGAASLQIVTSDQGWSGSGGTQTDSDTISITVNSLNPRVVDVSATTANGTYKVGDTITITTTFDQAVTVDTTGGAPTLLLETGSTDRIATYVSGSGSNTLTFSYTVQAGDLSADLDYQSTAALALNGGTIRDTLNRDAVLTLSTPGTAGSLGANQALVIDGIRPDASIVVADATLAIGETSQITITFSEAVTGLTTADFTTANGVLSGLSSSDGGITWTATLTPTASITDSTNLITLDNTGVSDAVGNTGSGSTNSNNYAIDTQRPTATIVVADTSLAIGETSLVTISFSEAVTGFTLADMTVANGTLSGLSTSDNITYTATLTPSAGISDTSNLITLNNSGVQDGAGNSGSGITDSTNYSVDSLRPTATIALADPTLKAGETSLVTITFSEAVSGFSNADMTVANGSLGAVSSSDGGITWTATFTPTAGITDTNNIISLNNGGISDLAGNTGSGTTSSGNYSIETERPTATIVIADNALTVGETTTVTITFSEAVSGFSNADLTLANGSLSAVSSSDGGITWTATLTPSADVSDSSNLITLDNTGVTNASGNTGTGSTISNNFAIDTARPTASIVVTDSTLTIGETTSVTITFSEAVSGFDLSDLSVANGSLSNLSSSDGGITWTATLTPTAEITDATNLITLDNSGLADLAGNTGTGSTTSNNYAIDTAAVLVIDNGDPEFRAYPPVVIVDAPTTPLQPLIPPAPLPNISPLLPPPLFEVQTLGSGIPTLGNIFINNGALAPSFIAQVFASSSDAGGDGSGSGFLGFGGGDAGVFGSSSLSNIFGEDAIQESEQLEVFDGKKWGSGGATGAGRTLGAPTLGQQLHELHENEQRPLRELALALGQFDSAESQA